VLCIHFLKHLSESRGHNDSLTPRSSVFNSLKSLCYDPPPLPVVIPLLEVEQVVVALLLIFQNTFLYRVLDLLALVIYPVGRGLLFDFVPNDELCFDLLCPSFKFRANIVRLALAFE